MLCQTGAVTCTSSRAEFPWRILLENGASKAPMPDWSLLGNLRFWISTTTNPSLPNTASTSISSTTPGARISRCGMKTTPVSDFGLLGRNRQNFRNYRIFVLGARQRGLCIWEGHHLACLKFQLRCCVGPEALTEAQRHGGGGKAWFGAACIWEGSSSSHGPFFNHELLEFSRIGSGFAADSSCRYDS